MFGMNITIESKMLGFICTSYKYAPTTHIRMELKMLGFTHIPKIDSSTNRIYS